MNWGAPHLLHLLWTLPFIAWALLALRRRRLALLERFAAKVAWPSLAPGWDASAGRARVLLWTAAIGFCFLGLARPQWGLHLEEVRRRGLDLMICIDTSRSMLAEDLKPNRLEQAKYGVRDLLTQLRGDRVGLVAFAGSSFLQCPLTSDYAAFRMMLDDVQVGLIPRGGTALGPALQTALDGFEKAGDADRAIILITDGENTEGDPAGVVAESRKRGIRIFTVGVGSSSGELIPAADSKSAGAYLKDNAGNVVKSRLDEQGLSQIALQTGGAYVRAAAGDLGLERLMREHLSDLKKAEGESRVIRTHEDRFVWFLLAAFVLFAVEASLSHRRRVEAAR